MKSDGRCGKVFACWQGKDENILDCWWEGSREDEKGKVWKRGGKIGEARLSSRQEGTGSVDHLGDLDF